MGGIVKYLFGIVVLSRLVRTTGAPSKGSKLDKVLIAEHVFC